MAPAKPPKSSRDPDLAAVKTTSQGRRKRNQEGRGGGQSKRSDLRYKEIRHLLARKEREKAQHAETLIEEL